jgi:hypothetical protein
MDPEQEQQHEQQEEEEEQQQQPVFAGLYATLPGYVIIYTLFAFVSANTSPKLVESAMLPYRSMNIFPLVVCEESHLQFAYQKRLFG